MFQDINAVIFDLDGTLVDSMWMWRDIDIEFLSKYGIEFPDNLQSEIEGMSFSETAIYFKTRFALKLTIEEIKTEWNQMAWEKYMTQVPLKTGAFKLLQFLRDNQIKAGIATSNSRELVDLVIDKLNVKEYFSSIRTSCEVEKGKPAPDIYLLVANDLKVSADKCLVFEDVIQGIMAGKNAGMKVCAVYDHFTREDNHKKQELADYYIESFIELF
ncbi:HAD family hydrolase [Anaerocolumna sp. MB42-C2]|uniref:HAD family hydrolase n=1 Tax=Anaerocolumna sp. MB42-C2 TaxID=3070997 RepID=UPI0027DF71DA|nr:HAD family phosphatase [Anaerocolumna sp. MB42-C2]WMJ90653.1 HAD family phosphatase [Anaerocolumna sp. MB42-C2]